MVTETRTEERATQTPPVANIPREGLRHLLPNPKKPTTPPETLTQNATTLQNLAKTRQGRIFPAEKTIYGAFQIQSTQSKQRE